MRFFNAPLLVCCAHAIFKPPEDGPLGGKQVGQGSAPLIDTVDPVRHHLVMMPLRVSVDCTSTWETPATLCASTAQTRQE